MIIKILISIVLAMILYFIAQYINLKRQNSIITKINKNILQSTMMYFVQDDIKEEDIPSFIDFTITRVKDLDLQKWMMNFKANRVDGNQLIINYDFKRSENTIQQISYEIRKKQ